MKKLLIWTFLSALLMIGGPWLALKFSGMDAMGICFILFYAVNPLFSVVCGAFAGKNIRQLWVLPLIAAGLFLVGVWVFFEMGEPAFLIYAAGYLVLGGIAMLVSAFIMRRK